MESRLDPQSPKVAAAAPNPAPTPPKANGKNPQISNGPKMPHGANPKRRHRRLGLSLLVLVLAPFIVIAGYLYLVAHDQYASRTGFIVRSDETTSASELVGGLSTIIGGGASGANGDVLFAFIRSQQIVERIQSQRDILGHYAQHWSTDPAFSIWPDATIEDLLWFWRRVVTVSYDKSSGLMDVQVLAFDAETARDIARDIVRESEEMINALNEQARRDSMANADQDLQDALDRVRDSREAMASFRARTQIVDPQADIQGRMGVINNLQQQLAQALVDHDLLLQTATDNDPRIRQAQRRIEVIEERIIAERRNFATQDVTVFDTDYPRLIAQFESLMVNQEFAEQTYTAALAARDAARSNAARQSLYLATFVRPTLAQQAEFPRRIITLLMSAFFLLMGWGAMSLVYYSLRDRG